MSIEFRCGGCNKLLRTPDESAGKKARCPDCGTIVDVPGSAGTAFPPASSPPPSSQSPSSATPGSVPFPEMPSAAPPTPPAPFFPAPPSVAPQAPVPQSPAPQFPAPQSSMGSPFGNPFAAPGSGPGAGGYGGPSGDSPDMQNPYAAPRLTEQPKLGAAIGGPLTHQQVTIEQMLKPAWEIFKKDIGMGILFGVIPFAMGMAINFVVTPINMAAQATNELSIVIAGQVIGQLLSFAVQAFVQLAVIHAALHWARTGIVDISRFFQVGSFYMRGLGIMFLVNLMIGGIALVCLTPGIAFAVNQDQEGTIIALIAGAVVAMPIATWLSLKFWFAMNFLVDRNCGVLESLRMSNQYMAGNKLTVLIAMMLIGLCAIPVFCLTCGFGMLAVVPVAALANIIAYLTVTGQPYRQATA